jgi:hypothetical protein
MSHIIHSSDTVKDCAPAVVHALVTLLAAICQLHSVSDVADVARNWARLCEALVSVHLKAIVKQVRTVLNLHNVTNQIACDLFVSCVVPAVCLCCHRNLAAIEDIAAGSSGAAAASRGWRSCPCQLLRQEAGDILTVLCVHHSILYPRMAHAVADSADSLLLIGRCALSIARACAASRCELQVHGYRVRAACKRGMA